MVSFKKKNVFNEQISFVRKRALKDGPSNKGILETTKRRKLAKLAGFELEMKKNSLVPKDTNF